MDNVKQLQAAIKLRLAEKGMSQAELVRISAHRDRPFRPTVTDHFANA